MRDWSRMVAGRGQQPCALRCALAAHGGRELGVRFAQLLRDLPPAHHALCAAHVAASVRPSAVRYVVAATVVRRCLWKNCCDG
ncbi:hypothetical protein F511_47665 [Dorcoceras hygrometricum]|uniref:Uncharacterized protein n=1 Tax=Dorcoceras hygrometricum TaxID=472368 RepID=A0A2Z6ZXM3_9LAMI|nr:hypothetical protein F511_47665 [Dorcoceras hygrometricum]